ncbi:hypothetical protein DPMN_131465 [Dreissena polymorpha]|uniref:Uncharacterized protein n=1 Tax=Dreissena polymorpha TaxID=45954 RepID=A0A9D4H9P6_DREPO|nr:hypothetical protein DPMN_064848 [Dreissena polymorpha]KAH3829469.1 hypothetical protein DPMN_131465 [Dreissena polymorpha]
MMGLQDSAITSSKKKKLLQDQRERSEATRVLEVKTERESRATQRTEASKSERKRTKISS